MKLWNYFVGLKDFEKSVEEWVMVECKRLRSELRKLESEINYDRNGA